MSDDDASQSFREHVEQIREDKYGDDSSGDGSGSDSEIRLLDGIAIFVGLLFGVGIMIGIITSGQSAGSIIIFGAVLIGVGIGIASLVTDWDDFQQNVETLKDMQNENEVSSSSKTICSSCGWQNPSDMSFCHDCGEELSTTGSSDTGGIK